MRGRGRWAAFLAAAVLAGPAAAAVDLGAPGPALQIAKWIKGEAVTLAQGKGRTIFVLDFWATWCGPCRAAIPRMSEFQRRLADKGVVLVGISDETPEVIAQFVQDTPAMDYRVAADLEKKTSAAYRRQERGIPFAVVVDRQGIVVWSGHPMLGLERAVEQALAGEFDRTTALKKQQASERVIDALSGGDAAAALKAADEIIALDRKDADSYRIKMEVLGSLGRTQEVMAVRAEMAKTFADKPAVLNDLAWDYVTDEDLALRDVDKALDLALRAVELTQEKDASALDTLARVYYTLCEIDKAMEVQQKAVLAASAQDKPKAQTVLEYYLKVRQTRAARIKPKPGG